MRDANRLPLKTRRNVLRWQSVPISSMWLHNSYSGPIDKIRWLTGGYEWKSRWITTKVNYTLGICLTSLWFIRIYLISSITADALGLQKTRKQRFFFKIEDIFKFPMECRYSDLEAMQLLHNSFPRGQSFYINLQWNLDYVHLVRHWAGRILSLPPNMSECVSSLARLSVCLPANVWLNNVKGRILRWLL